MKRMSDVYYLPLPLNQMDSMHDVCAYSYDTVEDDELAKSTARAINHVDALADALDALLASSIRMAGSENFYSAQDEASEALKAYRGEI